MEGKLIRSDYFITIIEKIDQMAECFYKQKNSEGFASLNQILALLGFVSESLTQYQNQSMDEYRLEFNQVLLRGMDSIEKKDTILIADIFYHEMAGLLHDIRNAIQ